MTGIEGGLASNVGYWMELRLFLGTRPPYPPLFVNVPGAALDGVQGPAALRLRAAVANTSRSGWCEASIRVVRRVLRTLPPPEKARESSSRAGTLTA